MSHSVLRRRHVVPFEPGFIGSNARVLTPQGMRSISKLQVGEQVVSYNHGAVPIVGLKTTLSPCTGSMQPVVLQLNGTSDIMVSPTSLLMIKSKYSDLYFGSSKALVQASSLRGSDVAHGVKLGEHVFFSLIIERVDIIYVENFLFECRGDDEGPFLGAGLDFCNLANNLGQYPVLDDDEARLLFECEGGADRVLQFNTIGEQK